MISLEIKQHCKSSTLGRLKSFFRRSNPLDSSHLTRISAQPSRTLHLLWHRIHADCLRLLIQKHTPLEITHHEHVAFVVSHSVDLDIKSASSDYIQLYDGNKETLVASLDRIQKTACTIIEAINDHDGNDGSSQSRNDNTPKPPVTPVASDVQVAKPEIEVHELEPDRFALGEFCYQKERTVGEGDIALSYSADKIAESDTVCSPFTWKGRQ